MCNIPSTLFRLLQPEDESEMVQLIRSAVLEFNCLQSEYLSNQEELENLYNQYKKPLASYWVILDESTQTILGGGGIAPLTGTLPNEHIYEIQKMYFVPEARGRGLGKKLLNILLQSAQNQGADYIYLETMPTMTGAIALYKKFGFQPLPARLGNTGHESCNVFMGVSLAHLFKNGTLHHVSLGGSIDNE